MDEGFADGVVRAVKEGRRSREDHERQGDQADGGGRCQGHAAGIPPRPAGPAKVKLLRRTLDNINVIEAEDEEAPPKPERPILDRGYDSEPLRRRPANQGSR